MAIKNKDGSEYTLSSPNPIMSEMAIWNRQEKLILHNIHNKLIDNESAKVIRNSIPEIVAKIEPVQPKEKPIVIKPVIQEEQGSISIIDSFENRNSDLDIDKTKIWCSPAKSMDGDKVIYGKKFIFEAIIEDTNDFQILLYTTTKDVTEGSIIYPRNYENRWWRVASVHQEDSLFRLVGIVTDCQFDFS